MTSANAGQANVVVAREIAKRYGDRGIVSLSVDPGERYAAFDPKIC